MIQKIKSIFKELGLFKSVVVVLFVLFWVFYGIRQHNKRKKLEDYNSECVKGIVTFSLSLRMTGGDSSIAYIVNGKEYELSVSEMLKVNSKQIIRYNIEDPNIAEIDNDCVQILDNKR